MLEAKAGSVLGKEKARAVLPSGDFAEVEELLRETEEAVRLSAFSSPPMGGVFDIRESLAKAERGAVLDLGDFTDACRQALLQRSGDGLAAHQGAGKGHRDSRAVGTQAGKQRRRARQFA